MKNLEIKLNNNVKTLEEHITAYVKDSSNPREISGEELYKILETFYLFKNTEMINELSQLILIKLNNLSKSTKDKNIIFLIIINYVFHFIKKYEKETNEEEIKNLNFFFKELLNVNIIYQEKKINFYEIEEKFLLEDFNSFFLLDFFYNKNITQFLNQNQHTTKTVKDELYSF
ncbi:hypothetical protein [Campylobacter canadensis]|uniref:hypothetical protein n=1 Tax=Campylobacter canadensis TaxID=449520 RepID=UPI001CCEAFB9|nr:hypothetical protein [Campylobacter canadensis]MBZ8002801.1 hypothetical protein [Campylobacter canadensis]